MKFCPGSGWCSSFLIATVVFLKFSNFSGFLFLSENRGSPDEQAPSWGHLVIYTHLDFCESRDQNPLVKNRKKKKILDCKAIFSSYGGVSNRSSKNKYHSIYKTNNLGTVVTVKNNPVKCFTFLSSFSFCRGVSCKKN